MLTRRDFLRNAAFGVAAATVISPLLQKDLLHAAEEATKVAPSDKLRVGLIGCRNMGWNDLKDFLLVPYVDCVALCDVKQEYMDQRAEDVLKLRGVKPKMFNDYRKLLEMKELDAVIIGTPDHWHCLMFVDACASGKDVYVEKPIANTIAEGDIMVRAAKRYNRVIQVGQQQRSGKYWAQMADFIQSGQLGRVAKVDIWGNFDYAAGLPPMPDTAAPSDLNYDMWLGPAPLRPFNEGRWNRYWRMYWSYGGGLVSDWGVHLFDMGLWGLGKTTLPKAIVARGGKYLRPDYASETFDTMTISYDFGDCLMNWIQCAGTETGFYGRNYGLAFKGVNGTVVADRGGWEVIPEKNRGLEPQKVKGSNDVAHRDHCREFVEAVKSRNFDTACTVERGNFCAKYGHLGNIAARTGKALVYDETKASFNDAEANKYLKPTYRSPWKLPNI
ncbi:NADH-dependent dehydrogenase [Bacteroidia bacterium]|nr:NADH-dependent dehydrogenase [Bacteroidia bacterium]